MGDTTPGGAGVVTTLNQPFVNGAEDPGFTAAAAENFVFSGAGVIWVNSDGLPAVLTGAEFTMGIGDLGEYIFSPSTDGRDSLWTDAGLPAVENVQAPWLTTAGSSYRPISTSGPAIAAIIGLEIDTCYVYADGFENGDTKGSSAAVP